MFILVSEELEPEHKRIGKGQRSNQLTARNDQFEPYLIGASAQFVFEA